MGVNLLDIEGYRTARGSTITGSDGILPDSHGSGKAPFACMRIKNSAHLGLRKRPSALKTRKNLLRRRHGKCEHDLRQAILEFGVGVDDVDIHLPKLRLTEFQNRSWSGNAKRRLKECLLLRFRYCTPTLLQLFITYHCSSYLHKR